MKLKDHFRIVLLSLSLCNASMEATTVFGIEPMSPDLPEVAVAIDNNGNAVSVFPESGLMDGKYSPGNFGWGPAVVISDNIPNKFAPSVAMEPVTGKALAVWEGSNSPNSSIETNALIGGNWGIPIVLETSVVNTLVSPAVSMNRLGNGVAAWISQGPDQVHASFNIGGIWTPFQAISSPLTAANGTSIAYSDNGTAVVGWTRFDIGISNLYATIFNGAIWLPETLLDTQAESFPEVGIDANGNALAVWIGNIATSDVKWSRYDGISWSAPQILSLAPGNNSPGLAVSPDGSALAVWSDAGGVVQLSRFNGSVWSTQTPIAPGFVPAVAIDSADNAIISWGFGSSLFVAYLPAGGVLGTPILVKSGGNNISFIDLGLSIGSNVGVIGWDETFGEGEGNSFATFVLFDPLPAAAIAGFVCNNTFATQTDRVHFITWEASLDPTVTAYYIFRNGVLVATVPASGPFIFSDHNQTKGVPVTYTVFSVNAEGFVSAPLSITLD